MIGLFGLSGCMRYYRRRRRDKLNTMQNPLTTGAGESVYPRSHRLIRRLSIVYASALLAVGVLLLLALLPAGIAAPTRALAHEAIAGGLAATVLAALLLSLTGLMATQALTLA